MSILKRVHEMPDSGQFIAVYVHNDEVWAITIRRKLGTILQYNEESDDFEDRGTSAQWLKSMNPIYYVTA